MRYRATAVCLVAFLTAISGCGSPGISAPEDVTAVPGASKSPETRDVRCWGPFSDDVAANLESLADVLPNTLVKYRGSDAPAESMTTLVVTGRIVDVVPGRAWAAGEDEADDDRSDGTVVPFDDPDALWKHVHATVVVEEVLGASGAKQQREEVLVAFTLGGSEQAAMARDQLVGDDLVVFPLVQWSGTDYLPDLWSVGPGNASLVAEVRNDGALSLPCLSKRNSERLLAGVGSLAALRDVALRPERVIAKKPLYLA